MTTLRYTDWVKPKDWQASRLTSPARKARPEVLCGYCSPKTCQICYNMACFQSSRKQHKPVPESHLIKSVEELATLYGSPRPSSQSKVRSYLTVTMQNWLSHSPFFVLSSNGPEGIDCSPRGDTAGEAFHILDQHHIAIPDRPGNNRIETLRNIITDPRVGLVFLIPGVEETLRIKGNASISVEPSLLRQFALSGVAPATVMLINVNSAYVQNARAIRHAQLWKAQANAGNVTIPSARKLYD